MEEADNNKDSNDATSPSSSNPKSKLVPYECKICGAPAIHSNYGAISCYPCKMFFKRNATTKQNQFTCYFNGQCEINITNRHICSTCRLNKCFTSGMQTDLIRCPTSRKNVPTQNMIFESITATSNILRRTSEQTQLQLLSTTNLLQSDNSILTTHQWTLLSNLIYSYDETKLISIAQQFINEYDSSEIIDSTLPKEFFMKIYETTGVYIRSNGDLFTLSSDDRSTFLRNIAENVTCLGTVLCWSRSQIYNFKPFINIYINFYGENLVTMIQRVLKFIDPDIVISKLALSIFAFSNNSSIFSPNMTIKPLNTLTIFHIQNIYAEIIWKYLLYTYGYYQSIQRFINLIQCLLEATNTVLNAQNIEKHVNDIESLIEETELTLILDDIECIDEKKN